MPINAPSRAELLALVQAWRHEQQTHHRAAAGTHARDAAVDRMRRIDAAFERTLRSWVVDERLRQAWRNALHHQAPIPLRPSATPLVAFRGRGDNNSDIEVRPGADNLMDVFLDGAHVDRIKGLDLATREGRTLLRYRNNTYEEGFRGPPESLEALRAWVAAPESPPPLAWLRDLVDDGVLDGNLSVTPRGRRVLAGTRIAEMA